MTQVSAIITDAFRETNLIALNTSPAPAEMVEGLARLQAVVLSTLGNDVSYNMEDWTLVSATSISNPSNVALTAAQAAAYFVKPQSRLIANLGAATAINLDPMPQDGQRFSALDALNNFATRNLTINGNGRRIDGGTSKVLNTNGARFEAFYRSDLAEWVEITDLQTTDDLPFPEDYDDYFITKLAMRLDPRYGRPLPPEVAARYAEQQQQIIDRYTQSRIRGSGSQKIADRAGGPPQG